LQPETYAKKLFPLLIDLQMENPGLFTMLQPKQTQFVLESAGGGYRPKSTMAARKRKVLDTSEDQQMLR
jgi:hypothetical protein